jgi:hypothetical protein
MSDESESDSVPAPSAEDVREALLRRAEAYCRAAGISLTDLGKTIANDKDLFHRIRKGANFTIGKYAKAMAYLEENWPTGTSAEEQRVTPAG